MLEIPGYYLFPSSFFASVHTARCEIHNLRQMVSFPEAEIVSNLKSRARRGARLARESVIVVADVHVARAAAPWCGRQEIMCGWGAENGRRSVSINIDTFTSLRCLYTTHRLFSHFSSINTHPLTFTLHTIPQFHSVFNPLLHQGFNIYYFFIDSNKTTAQLQFHPKSSHQQWQHLS